MEWTELNTERYYVFINNIIANRGQWTPVVFENSTAIFENHHIILRCFGGLPRVSKHVQKNENLIWLTPAEHFTVHRILAEDNQDCVLVQLAFSEMCRVGKGQHRELSMDDYAALRLAYHRINCGKNNPACRPDVRAKISKTRLESGCAVGSKNPNFGHKYSEEELNKIKNATKEAMQRSDVKINFIRNNKQIRCIKCITLDRLFCSVTEAAKWYRATYNCNISRQRIGKYCANNITDNNGLQWTFIDKEEYIRLTFGIS